MSQNFDLTKGEYIDDARAGRVVPVKFYVPHEDGPHPLVLWSHGLGGTRDGAGFISRALVEIGIMVVHMQHDGTDDVLWRGKPGHPWDNIRATPLANETLIDRWLDVPFVLDRVLQSYAIDQTRIGFSGHSMGALTVQILCGQYWPDERGALRSYADPRIGHGLLYSPIPSLSVDHPSAVFEHIDRPILHITGTNDVSPLSGYGYEERFRIFDNAVKSDRIMIVIEGADHMVFAGSRGQLASYPQIAEHEDLIRDLSIAYWQGAFAGHDMGAIRSALADRLDNEGTLDYRPAEANLAA